MEAGNEILSKLGKYPVLFLTMKSAQQDSFENAFYHLKTSIQSEIDRHRYLLNSQELNTEEKEKLNQWISSDQTPYYFENKEDRGRLNNDVALFSKAFREVSAMLKKHHGENVVILMDEYDVPLESSYFAGYYDQMVNFIRSFFESTLKTNDALEIAVITGCLRISRESIFTGLNHLEVNTVRSTDFGDFFGFTQEEVNKMLLDYGIEDKADEARKWYDGYLFGNSEVYNPWSVTKYVKDQVANPARFPEPYWSNTSSNSIIKDLVYRANDDMKQEIDCLIQGGTIEKTIHEDITYEDVRKSEDNLWNFLFFTGYLRKVSERKQEEDILITMRIPNAEIRSIYRNQIREWFDREIMDKTDRTELHEAIIKCDVTVIGEFITSLLKKTISTFDSEESFYHRFILSLMFGLKDYETKSNREEGDGRPDITLYPQNPRAPAYVFEIKTRKKFNQMEDGIRDAFKQIRDKRYEEGILDDGYAKVISFGVCCCKKSCLVELMD